MTVTIEIPAMLRNRCGGATQLRVTAKTLRAVLQQLEDEYPDLYGSLCDETGAVRPHVNLFVNSTLACGDRHLAARLKPGDTVSIFPAVSGG